LKSTQILCALLLIAGAAPLHAAEPYAETIAGTKMKIDMVPIPGGTFKMGSPESEKGRKPDEGPQVEVEIKPFYMSKYEILWEVFEYYAYKQDLQEKNDKNVDREKQPETEKAADAVTRPTPPYVEMTFGLGHDNQPAICMTHHSAMEFCRWLSAKTGKVYRLATEAEWEYACRAGTTTAYSFGDDPAQLGEYAWFAGNADSKPQPVGKKKPNPWGLYDMHGNVSEWVLDVYHADAYKTWSGQKQVGPVMIPTKEKYPHVARGGSWTEEPPALRSAARRASDEEWSMQDPQLPKSIWWHTEAQWVGIRVVHPVEEQENLKELKSTVTKEGD
jgi:formylglycine-generating enzyme required for sulfatase activity